MQSVTIRLDRNDYEVLRNKTHYWLQWCYGHFKTRKSQGIEPEPIVATMYERYFSKYPNHYNLRETPKNFHVDYYEAKALMEVTCVCIDSPTVKVRKIIQTALDEWQPSLSQLTMQKWYEKEEAMVDTFGPYDDLSDLNFEVVNNIYNQNFLT